jgi:hypothetical protein
MSTPNAGKRARESEIELANQMSEESITNPSMILTAQHKALATNLYRYKRRISQLETNVNGLSETNATLYQSIAAITARVALVSLTFLVDSIAQECCANLLFILPSLILSRYRWKAI